MAVTEQQINDITGLYVAYFNRAPDPAGLEFWIDQLENGRPFDTIAEDFAASPEATSIYPFLADPENNDPDAFIVQIYNNLFNRDPDAAGLEFWSGVLAEGTVPLGDFIEAVLLGAQDTIVDGVLIEDKTTVENKIEAGLYYAETAGARTEFEFDQRAYDSAVGTLEGVTADPASVDQGKAAADSFLATLLPSTVHTLHEKKMLVEEGVDTVPTETVLYWGYNPHGHDETDGVDNTAEPNTNNLTNEGPEDGGIPAEDALLYIGQIAAIDWEEIDTIDTDAGGFPQLDGLNNISLVENDDGDQSGTGGTATLTLTYDDYEADIAIGEAYVDLVRDLIFDEEGNSRFFEKEVPARQDVWIDGDGEPTLVDPGLGNDPVGQVDVVIEGEDVYANVPLVLTPEENNGSTVEFAKTTDDDDLIVAGRLDLLHGAYIDGGGGVNVLDIDAKGHFAQPKALLNVQHVNIQNLPNIYTDDDDDNSNEYPDVVEDGIGDPDSIVDLSRAVDIQTIRITEGDFAGLDGQNLPGFLTVSGIRDGATPTVDGNFEGGLRLNYSGASNDDGLTIVLHNANVEGNFEVAHNAVQMNIVSTGGGNHLDSTDLDGTSEGNLRELFISGDAHLYIESDLGGGFDLDTPVTIDASANTAGVDLNISGPEQVTFVGTSADDRFAVRTTDSSASAQGPDFNNDQKVVITDLEGDNYFDITSYSAEVTLGEGDNQVEIQGDSLGGGGEAIIEAGDGDNVVEGFVAYNRTTLGDGDNRIELAMQPSPETSALGSGPFIFDGKDDFDSVVQIDVGDGANVISVREPSGVSENLKASEIIINAGDGGNEINIPDLPMFLPGVGNYLDLSTVSITTGAGDDTMTVGASDISISSGGGNDTLTLYGIDNDYVTQAGSTIAPNFIPFVPSNFGASLNIDTGDGAATINLGASEAPSMGANGSIVAKEGSTITGEDITLFVNTLADLRAAELDGISEIVLDDSSTYFQQGDLGDGGDDRNDGDAAASNIASLTLLDTQLTQLLSDGVTFNTEGQTFGAESLLTVVITDDVALSDLVDLASWNDSVKLSFVVEDGASLTLTAEELHKYVAPNGIAVNEQNGYIDNQITVTDAGPGFDAYSDQNGGVGGGTIAGNVPMQDVTVLFSPDGFERPEQDDPVDLIQWNSDEAAVVDQTIYPFATDLEITGAADLDVNGPIILDDNFTIDFSEFGGTFADTVAGVPTLTVANFQDITADVNDTSNDANDGDVETDTSGDPFVDTDSWGEITGNGTSEAPVRINMLVEEGTSTGDSDFGPRYGGFKSSGVQQFVLVGFHAEYTPGDGAPRIASQAESTSADIVVCDQTEDLEVIGLQNNRNADVTFHQVNWTTSVLLEGDGYANASDQEKNLGDPDLSQIGNVTVNYAEGGANARILVNNQGTELGQDQDAEDGFDAEGERKLDVASLSVSNADRINVQVEDGDATINAVNDLGFTDGDGGVERLIVSGPEDVTLVIDGVNTNGDDTGLNSEVLESIDGTAVDGDFTLRLTEDANFSEVALSGIDAILADRDNGDITLTHTADQAAALGGAIATVGDDSNDSTLNITDMADQVLDLTGVDVDVIGTVTFREEAEVTVDPATNFGGASELIIPEDSVVTMANEVFETADYDPEDLTDGPDVSGDGTLVLAVSDPGADFSDDEVDVKLFDVGGDVDVDILLSDITLNQGFDISINTQTSGTVTLVLDGETDITELAALGVVDQIRITDGANVTVTEEQLITLNNGGDLSDIIQFEGDSATLNIAEIKGDGVPADMDLDALLDVYPNLNIGELSIANDEDVDLAAAGYTLGGADAIVTPEATDQAPDFGNETTTVTLSQAQYEQLADGTISGEGTVNLTEVENNTIGGPGGQFSVGSLVIDTANITANRGTVEFRELDTDGTPAADDGSEDGNVGEQVILAEESDLSGFAIQLSDGQLIGYTTAAQATGAVVENAAQADNPTGVAWFFEEVPAEPVDTSGYDSDLDTLFIPAPLADGANEEALWTQLSSAITVEKFQGEVPAFLVINRVNTWQPFSAAPEGIRFDDTEEGQTVETLTLNLEGGVALGSVGVSEMDDEARFKSLTINSYFDEESLGEFGIDADGDGITEGLKEGFDLADTTNTVGDIDLSIGKADDPLVITLNTSDGQEDANTVRDGTSGDGVDGDIDSAGEDLLDAGAALEVGTITLGAPGGDATSADIFVTGDNDITIGGVDFSDPGLTQVNVVTGGIDANDDGDYDDAGDVAPFNFTDADLEIGGDVIDDVAEDMGIGGDLDAIVYVDNLTADEDTDLDRTLDTGSAENPNDDNIILAVANDNDLTEVGTDDDVFDIDGIYAQSAGTLTLTAAQVAEIGTADGDDDGAADAWQLAPGVNPGDVTLNITDLEGGEDFDLDAVRDAGFDIGTITVAATAGTVTLGAGATLGGADEIIIELDDDVGDVTLEMTAAQYQGFSGVITEDPDDVADSAVANVVIDELEALEDDAVDDGAVTIDLSTVATTGANFVHLRQSNGDPIDADPDTAGLQEDETLYDGDVSLTGAANLGNFGVALWDRDDDNQGGPDPVTPDQLEGDTIRFATVEQADGRTVFIGDPDLGVPSLVGPDPFNTGEKDTNVVFNFTEAAEGIDASGYSSDLGRVWLLEELVVALGGDVDSLFTITDEDTGALDFTLAEEIIKVVEPDEIPQPLQGPVGLTQRVEVRSFFNETGLEFEIDDPIDFVENLRIDMGGVTDIANLVIDNIVDPEALELDDDDFETLTINSLLADSEDHYLLPDGFDPDTDSLPTDPGFVDNSNNIGDIVGFNADGADPRGVLLDIDVFTFDAEFGGAPGDDAGVPTGAQLNLQTVFFAGKFDDELGADYDPLVDGDAATFTADGENDVTVKSFDTSDAGVTSLLVDTTNLSATLAVSGGSPAFQGGDDTGETETLDLDGGNESVTTFASNLVLDETTGEVVDIAYNLTDPDDPDSTPYSGISAADLSLIDATGHSGTVSLGVISSVDPEEFTLEAGTDGQVYAALGTGDDEGTAETATISDTGTWTFNGTAGAGADGASNLDLEISALTAPAGATLDLNAVDLLVTGDVNLTDLGLGLQVDDDSSITVEEGNTLTLTVEQADALADLQGGTFTITGGGTLAIVDGAGDGDNADFGSLFGTGTVDLSGVSITAADSTDSLDYDVVGATDAEGERVTQTVIGSDANDELTAAASVSDGDDTTIDLVTRLGADVGAIGAATVTGADDDTEVVGDTIDRTVSDAQIQVEVDAGFDTIDFTNTGDVYQVASGAAFYGEDVASAFSSNLFTATADSSNEGTAVLEAADQDDDIDVSLASGAWVLVGQEDDDGGLPSPSGATELTGSAAGDTIVDGAANTTGDNDGVEDILTGNAGADTLLFDVGKSQSVEFNTFADGLVQQGIDIETVTFDAGYVGTGRVLTFELEVALPDLGITTIQFDLDDGDADVDLSTNVLVAEELAERLQTETGITASADTGVLTITGLNGNEVTVTEVSDSDDGDLTGGGTGDADVDPTIDDTPTDPGHANDPSDEDDDRAELVIQLDPDGDGPTPSAGEVYTLTLQRANGSSDVFDVTATSNSFQDLADLIAETLNDRPNGLAAVSTGFGTPPTGDNALQTGTIPPNGVVVFAEDADEGGIRNFDVQFTAAVSGLSSSSIIDGGTDTSVDDVDADLITDFVSGTDKIDFDDPDLPAGTGVYGEAAQVADFTTALTAANDAMTNDGVTYYFTSVDDGANEGLLFYDANGDDVADGLVRLQGVDETSFDGSDIA